MVQNIFVVKSILFHSRNTQLKTYHVVLRDIEEKSGPNISGAEFLFFFSF